MQIKKRKEDLEFELDVLEKNIQHVKSKMAKMH
jgi:chaperonin cofactor prefoldin